MQQDRDSRQHTDSTSDVGGGSHPAGGAQQPEPDRRAGQESATRDYQQRMQQLDSAGTVDETHDRDAGGDSADGAGSERDVPDQDGQRRSNDAFEPKAARSTRDMVRGNALTLGLAASSLALLAAGTRGGGGGSGAVADEVAAGDAFMPPAEVAEKKGVTWDLHVSDHDRVDFFVEFLMGRNYDKTREWIELIGRYGPMIQNELRDRGMPEDLLYLAMIESGLNPNAYSKAHAAGIWQFISETGKRYGLEHSTWVDERRDPVKATAAALTYLQEMHDRFGSWYLSAAGYNTGENRVGRLMRERTGSEKGTDEGYWEIWERLPAETRDYVPLMLAMGHIAKEPAKYGFHDIAYREPLKFEEVIVPGGTKLSDVARTAGVDAATVEDLNPHFVKKQTPPDRRMAVRVPVGQSAAVAAAFNGQTVYTGVFAD
jgi:hypothetical protein